MRDHRTEATKQVHYGGEGTKVLSMLISSLFNEQGIVGRRIPLDSPYRRFPEVTTGIARNAALISVSHYSVSRHLISEWLLSRTHQSRRPKSLTKVICCEELKIIV